MQYTHELHLSCWRSVCNLSGGVNPITCNHNILGQFQCCPHRNHIILGLSLFLGPSAFFLEKKEFEEMCSVGLLASDVWSCIRTAQFRVWLWRQWNGRPYGQKPSVPLMRAWRAGGALNDPLHISWNMDLLVTKSPCFWLKRSFTLILKVVFSVDKF